MKYCNVSELYYWLLSKCVQVWSKKWNIMMQIWQSLSQVSIVTRTRSKDLWHFIMYVCGRNDFGESPIRSVIWQKLMTGVRQGFVLSCYLLSDAWCSDRDLFRSNHLTVGPPLYSTVTFTSYLQKLNHPYHLIESRFVSPNKVIGLRLTRSLS